MAATIAVRCQHAQKSSLPLLPLPVPSRPSHRPAHTWRRLAGLVLSLPLLWVVGGCSLFGGSNAGPPRQRANRPGQAASRVRRWKSRRTAPSTARRRTWPARTTAAVIRTSAPAMAARPIRTASARATPCVATSATIRSWGRGSALLLRRAVAVYAVHHAGRAEISRSRHRPGHPVDN